MGGRGFVKNWTGRFADVHTTSRLPSPLSSATPSVSLEDPAKERFVEYPGMHSICRNLLHHRNIRVVLQTRACATYHTQIDTDRAWEAVEDEAARAVLVRDP